MNVEMNVEITAHRGACYEAPENTLSAINLAWQRGADAVEIDLRLCATGEIAVIHDADTRRVAGVDKPVAAQSWEELRALDVGAWKDARFAGEQIPSLDEVLATVPPNKRLQIEVKCGPEIIGALRSSLEQSGVAPEAIVLTSFNGETLRALKSAFARVPAWWICNLSNKNEAPDQIVERMIGQAREAGFGGLCLGQAAALDLPLAARVREANLELCAWPVDSPALARRWSEAGATCLTTNRIDIDWLAPQSRPGG